MSFIKRLVPCFLIAGLVLLTGCNETLECPNFVGKSYELISTGEQYDMFDFKVKYVESDKDDGGMIVSQDVKVGEKLDSGDTITLHVSLGAPKSNVPDVTGLDADSAEIIIKSAGFGVTKVYASNDKYDEGICFSTFPKANEPQTNGKDVILYISIGNSKKLVAFINVVGKSHQEAVKALSDIGLNVGNVSFIESDKASGTVIEQYPEYAKSIEIAEGSKINLVIAK